MINWTFIREVGAVRWMTRYSLLQFRKRVLNWDSKLLLPTGLRITLPRQSPTATEIFVTNANMDWGSEDIFVRFADPQRDFLDIGANIGYYATYLSPRVRHVYAFEPNPKNFPGLRANAGLSQNIEVVEMAVSSKDGDAEFFTGMNSSVGSLNSIGGAAIRVFVTTIDTFLAKHPGVNVGLVKIDIEGQDFEALRGMERTVAKFQPLILTECELSPDLIALCSRWNYRIFGSLKERVTGKLHFREFKIGDYEKYSSKMLFLAPESLHASFVHLIEK